MTLLASKEALKAQPSLKTLLNIYKKQKKIRMKQKKMKNLDKKKLSSILTTTQWKIT